MSSDGSEAAFLHRAQRLFRQWVRTASRLLDIVEGGCVLACATVLALSVLAISVDVLRRQYLGGSLPWVVQVSEYMMLYLAFLPAAWILRRQGHVVVDIFLTNMATERRRRLEGIIHLLGALVCTTAFYYSAGIVWLNYERGTQLYGAITVPRWAVLAALPLGFGLLSLEFIRQVWRRRSPPIANGPT